MNKKNLICFGQCVVAAIAGAFITHILIQYFGGYIEACKANEPNTHCTREWVSALSGWVAALAAGMAIWPILGQLKEQRQQASFALGNTKPTVDVERLAPLSIRVRIVNWNRRALKIRPLQYKVGNQILYTRSSTRKTEKPEQASSGEFGFTIQGWEDRAQRPPFTELMIELDGHGNVEKYETFAIVEIDGVLIGEGGGRFYEKTTVSRWGQPPL